jgi:hypothetical protein
MTKPIQLHVGYVGITREGKRVEIIDDRGSNVVYRWRGKDDGVYTNDGRFGFSKADCTFDIVGPWVETPVETLADYNDGKWHRWAGGDRPVHPSSVVHAKYIHRGDLTEYTQGAIGFTWDTTVDPIVAFRVTKEYVEPPKVPREFWLLQGKIYSYYHMDPDAIHVREVLTDD